MGGLIRRCFHVSKVLGIFWSSERMFLSFPGCTRVRQSLRNSIRNVCSSLHTLKRRGGLIHHLVLDTVVTLLFSLDRLLLPHGLPSPKKVVFSWRNWHFAHSTSLRHLPNVLVLHPIGDWVPPDSLRIWLRHLSKLGNPSSLGWSSLFVEKMLRYLNWKWPSGVEMAVFSHDALSTSICRYPLTRWRWVRKAAQDIASRISSHLANV